ncbi:arf-GAP with Rho-GAP domain, ANK repeat and PH domain-containing protein 3-like [Pelmatolapia mariae]|uniref:arf-GAP with Rho-GAP domain, ANK repeat and PH domain-containing protein 3-like n=1 Tax=Pelmatolapia mariae TaxID=158779 RepID=UPI002FE62CBD
MHTCVVVCVACCWESFIDPSVVDEVRLRLQRIEGGVSSPRQRLQWPPLPPSGSLQHIRWGFTVMSDKHQLYLCCSNEAELWDWITSLLRAQNDDSGPPVLRRHSPTGISKQKFGTMPLVPIRGDKSNSSKETTRPENSLHVLSHEGPAGLVRGALGVS